MNLKVNCYSMLIVVITSAITTLAVIVRRIIRKFEDFILSYIVLTLLDPNSMLSKY